MSRPGGLLFPPVDEEQVQEGIALEGTEGRTSVARFHPIDLDGLLVDTILDFNLYLQIGPGRYLLFRGNNLEFTVLHRNRLLDNGVRTLWVREDERGAYARYIEANIGQVIASPEIPRPKKATFLYAVSRNVLRAAFEDPRSRALVPRTRRLAQESVSYILQSDESLGLLASLMSKDYYTYTHSVNVAAFAVALAHNAGVLSGSELHELALGALLHDIGKTQLPRELLTKSGPLTEDEFALMREHVAFGERLIEADGRAGRTSLLAVSLHHERIDGSGYPRGVAGEELHLFGRIAAIADCFDAMTTNRAYQAALKPFDALMRIRTVLRTSFDQALVDRFIRLLRAPRRRAVGAPAALVGPGRP